MVVVLICDLLLPVCVSLPQLLVHHLLNLWTHIMSVRSLSSHYTDTKTAANQNKRNKQRLVVQTLMMLYLLNTPPALPPSLCSLMVLCI